VIYLLFICSAIAILASLSVWALRNPDGNPATIRRPPTAEFSEVRNATYLPAIRQALSLEDLEYLRSRIGRVPMNQTLTIRRRVAIAYLHALRDEFWHLLSLAHVAAVLSPEVNARHEIQRLRLTMLFALRFQLVKLRVRFNFAPLPAVASLDEMVSTLGLRLEAAIKELSERAALAGEIASSLDRRGLDSIG
jgi:hypothetical protein